MGDTVNYNAFPKGLDNIHGNVDVPKGALRGAVNVDILSSGRPRMRSGMAQAIADAGAHSVFAADDNTRMVYATGSTLKMVSPNLVATTILSNALLAKPLSFAELHGEIYFSNEDINGKVNALNTYEPWGVVPPSLPPTLTTTAGDHFIQVTCAFVLASGEVSGAPIAAQATCTDTPTVRVSNIPVSSDSRVLYTRIYVTDVDGKEFFQQVDVPNGITTTTISGALCLGEELLTQFMQPPPCGQLIEFNNGRFFVASGPVLYPTQPLRYGLYLPDEDYYPYPERITLVRGVQNGLFVSAEQTYFEQGICTPDHVHKPVLPYRAIEGASAKINVDSTKDVLWLSERGFVRGSAGGAVKNLTEGQLAVETGIPRACLGIHERQGHKAAIAIVTGGKTSPLVHKDYIEAEAERVSEVE